MHRSNRRKHSDHHSGYNRAKRMGLQRSGHNHTGQSLPADHEQRYNLRNDHHVSDSKRCVYLHGHSLLMNWLKSKLRKWLGFDDLEARIKDLERHFVTKRNADGGVVETLADVPLHERKERQSNMRGMNLEQRKRWLEETDGGRQVN